MAKLQAVSGCLLVFVACCNAHLCLLNPPQRGPPMGEALDNAGSDVCFRLEGPCGNQPESKHVITVRPGQFEVIFQKNLDHYNATLSSHGYFSVSLLHEGRSMTLKKIEDKGEKSLHLYTAVVDIPSLKLGSNEKVLSSAKRAFNSLARERKIIDDNNKSLHRRTAQLQVVYETKNDEAAPPAFYQCADIHIWE